MTTASALPPVVDADTWQRELDEPPPAREGGDARASTRWPAAAPDADGEAPRVCAAGAGRPGHARRDLRGQDTAHRLQPHVVSREGLAVPGVHGWTSQFTRLEFLDDYDARMVIVTQGPIDEALAYKERVGNRMEWWPTADSPFGAYMGAPPEAGFAVNVFLRDGDTVYRTWHTDGRAAPSSFPHMHGLVDVLPYGRQEEWQDVPDGWPQRPTYEHGALSQEIAAAYGPGGSSASA